MSPLQVALSIRLSLSGLPLQLPLVLLTRIEDREVQHKVVQDGYDAGEASRDPHDEPIVVTEPRPILRRLSASRLEGQAFVLSLFFAFLDETAKLSLGRVVRAFLSQFGTVDLVQQIIRVTNVLHGLFVVHGVNLAPVDAVEDHLGALLLEQGH